ncbi:hypothetical protein LINPERHAP2_LOCUS35676 [Linum perenne]
MTNSHGQVCDGRSGTFLCSSALAAETKAILEAILLAASRQVSTLILSDSQSIITILNNNLRPWPWECSAYITSMVHTLSQCPWISMDFIPRARNSNADWVAKETRKHSLPQNWIDVLNNVGW